MNGKGYIIDVPKTMVKTSAGDMQIYNASAGEIKFSQESLTISGGWSPFELKEIYTKKGIEISMTDTMFQMDTMKLSSGGTATKGATNWYNYGVGYVVDSTTHKIVLPYVVVTGSVKINGFTETTETTPGANEFKVTIDADATELLFDTSADGTTLFPYFWVETESTAETLSVTSDSFAKTGECIITFPIYDSESDDSSIQAEGQFLIYKASIRAEQTFGSSYKTASTFVTTLKGLDPQRPDKKIWDFTYRMLK